MKNLIIVLLTLLSLNMNNIVHADPIVTIPNVSSSNSSLPEILPPVSIPGQTTNIIQAPYLIVHESEEGEYISSNISHYPLGNNYRDFQFCQQVELNELFDQNLYPTLRNTMELAQSFSAETGTQLRRQRLYPSAIVTRMSFIQRKLCRLKNAVTNLEDFNAGHGHQDSTSHSNLNRSLHLACVGLNSERTLDLIEEHSDHLNQIHLLVENLYAQNAEVAHEYIHFNQLISISLNAYLQAFTRVEYICGQGRTAISHQGVTLAQINDFFRSLEGDESSEAYAQRQWQQLFPVSNTSASNNFMNDEDKLVP